MVRIENESEVTHAIKAVRSDAGGSNWVLVGHIDNQADHIRLVGSGNGGIDEMIEKFDAGSVLYGFLRVTQKIDLSTTVKFVYVYFIGEQVPALQRGKIGTAHGEIKKLFSPFHVDFEITNANEISSEIIDRKINETSGRVDNVREVSYDGSQHERGFTSGASKPPAVQKKSSFGFQGSAPTESKGISADPAVAAAVADVRSDKTETNWALAAYQDNDVKKPLVLLGTGLGGVDELTSHLTSELIAYGFIRVIDIIEGIKTVKFAFITFIGPDVSVMKKAKVSTNKGGVTTIFNPYHVSLEVTSTKELSDEIILTAVQEASGSKSKVK